MSDVRKTLIIAEAGVNHNGDISLGKELVDAAAEAGADYVKFQTFKSERLVSKKALKAGYQVENFPEQSGSQFEMLKKLELTDDDHRLLLDYATSRKIGFLSAPFDLESVEFLYKLGLNLIKIPSGELTNLPLLRKVGSRFSSIILSTGMANMTDISAAIEVIVESGVDKSNLVVLHCNTQYPTPMEDVNLTAMRTIAQTFDVKVGYSDHTLGTEVPIAAVALGASVIEKHFTIDRKLPGPDHKASLVPTELSFMISAIRNIERALGDGMKRPSQSEISNISVARKSIHLAIEKEMNSVILESDLIMLRPGDGISPMSYESLLGRKLKSNFPAGHKLQWDDIAQ